MLSGPQRKFCEGIVAGLNGTEAYAAAYPRGARTARNAAPRLLAKVGIQAEIERLRTKADAKASSAVSKAALRQLSKAQKRDFLARTVEAKIAELPRDSDLFVSMKSTEFGTEFRLGDKLAAIKLDNDLAGEGSEATANDEIAAMLQRICALKRVSS